ncbi:hypothetical protein NDU88_005038 [Pleurodeles waltl]|uniref:Uncharacterized protein n=1 Tax=Pleurodeles waltl TaxID=8319 RepID=A0AAV7UIP9_PLEWA|nr:hypothetical protein NDU88_005038 [Pleurodeles waltl]
MGSRYEHLAALRSRMRSSEMTREVSCTAGHGESGGASSRPSLSGAAKTWTACVTPQYEPGGTPTRGVPPLPRLRSSSLRRGGSRACCPSPPTACCVRRRLPMDERRSAPESLIRPGRARKRTRRPGVTAEPRRPHGGQR